MLSSLKNVFKVHDLRGKILFTLLMVVLYRAGAHIPVPGVDYQAGEAAAERGRARRAPSASSTCSRAARSASSPSSPSGSCRTSRRRSSSRSSAWSSPSWRSGRTRARSASARSPSGRATSPSPSRSLQATGLTFVFGRGGANSVFFGQGAPNVVLLPGFPLPRVLLVILTLTAGTVLLMWIGELITERGIGNGMSMLIFASVVSSLPFQYYALLKESKFVVFGFLVVLSLGHPGGHRVHGAGPTPDTRAVRQARRGPAHVRRPEHLHPAEDQPGRRHRHHLRQLRAVPPGPPRAGRPVGAGSRTSSNDYILDTTNWLHLSCTACSSSASRTSTTPSPSRPRSRPTSSASRAASSPASGPAPRPSGTCAGS